MLGCFLLKDGNVLNSLLLVSSRPILIFALGNIMVSACGIWMVAIFGLKILLFPIEVIPGSVVDLSLFSTEFLQLLALLLFIILRVSTELGVSTISSDRLS